MKISRAAKILKINHAAKILKISRAAKIFFQAILGVFFSSSSKGCIFGLKFVPRFFGSSKFWEKLKENEDQILNNECVTREETYRSI